MEHDTADSFRNSRIDLLRGIAIVLVILDHLALRIAPQQGGLPRWFINGVFSHGYEGVFIFFVISGFLIASHALSRWHRLDGIRLKQFYARRFSRIMPCLLILLAILTGLHLLNVGAFVIHQPAQSLQGAVRSALGFYLNWYEGRTAHYLPGPWDVLWSLSIEEMFYLGFPLVCLLLRREWLLAPCLVLLAVSLPWTRAAAMATGGEIWQEKAYLPGMSAIAIGVLAALLAARLPITRAPQTRILTVVGTTGIAAVLFADRYLWHLLHQAELLMLAVSTAVLLLAFAGEGRARANQAPWGTSWLRSFGRLSYEVYLTHMFAVSGATALYRAAGTGLLLAIVCYPAVLGLSWLLGMTIDRTFSTPSNRALRALLS